MSKTLETIRIDPKVHAIVEIKRYKEELEEIKLREYQRGLSDAIKVLKEARSHLKDEVRIVKRRVKKK